MPQPGNLLSSPVGSTRLFSSPLLLLGIALLPEGPVLLHDECDEREPASDSELGSTYSSTCLSWGATLSKLPPAQGLPTNQAPAPWAFCSDEDTFKQSLLFQVTAASQGSRVQGRITDMVLPDPISAPVGAVRALYAQRSPDATDSFDVRGVFAASAADHKVHLKEMGERAGAPGGRLAGLHDPDQCHAGAGADPNGNGPAPQPEPGPLPRHGALGAVHSWC